MPLPTWLARFNRRGTNLVTRRVAGRLPGFAVVRHVGRTSGRAYRTPVNLFRRGESYVIALTYGRDRDWVKNVLAAGSCRLETRDDLVPVEDPHIVADEKATLVPPGVRALLRAMGVTEFMILRRSAIAGGGPADTGRILGG